MRDVKKGKKSSNKLTSEEVKHVAYLARLGIADEEVEIFQKQLVEIIEFVGKLSEVNTENIEPTSQVTGLENVFREDEVEPSLSQEDILSNAPNKYKGFFKVKAIFE